MCSCFKTVSKKNKKIATSNIVINEFEKKENINEIELAIYEEKSKELFIKYNNYLFAYLRAIKCEKIKII